MCVLSCQAICETITEHASVIKQLFVVNLLPKIKFLGDMSLLNNNNQPVRIYRSRDSDLKHVILKW